MRQEIIRTIRKRIITWGKNNYQRYPWRESTIAWHGLVAEILLQRTRAKNVVPVYIDFTTRFHNPSDLAKAPIIKIKKVIYPLGLHWRSSVLKRLGKQIEINNGIIPTELMELRKLAGVGDYVAAAWLSFYGGKRSVIIDANIVRFLCRFTGRLRDAETRRKKWLIKTADELTPKRRWKEYNYGILDFTMEVCGREPKCGQCLFSIKLCRFSKRRKRMENILSA